MWTVGFAPIWLVGVWPTGCPGRGNRLLPVASHVRKRAEELETRLRFPLRSKYRVPLESCERGVSIVRWVRRGTAPAEYYM
ncbi:hypothetical protein NL676_002170 [Syzygium grande]|nr:hypothetical protein NL676_002170 [Syzygium grande]